MIEVHRNTDGKPIYINIDYIESIGTDHNEPNLTVINLLDRNGIDCIEETPKAILKKIQQARRNRSV
jgi:uncharacterized protein YlzI (FlbEa/FlbD family)